MNDAAPPLHLQTVQDSDHAYLVLIGTFAPQGSGVVITAEASSDLLEWTPAPETCRLRLDQAVPFRTAASGKTPFHSHPASPVTSDSGSVCRDQQA